MALTERMAGLNLSSKFHPLSVLAQRIGQVAKERIAKHGLFGELITVMVVASSLKLLWSHEFPLGWWIVLGLTITYEAVRDKFVWPREHHVLLVERERRLHDLEIRKLAKENANENNDQTS